MSSPSGDAVGRRPARPTRAEWGRLAGMAGFVALLHVVGWGLLLLLVVPGHYHLGDGKLFGVGIALTAYTLGLRHAFDADHLAAIDGTTRKLMADGQRPLSVGLFFSLGHSTVVLVLAVAVTAGIHGLSGDASWLDSASGVIGPTVSGTFLWLIGLLNLLVLISLLQAVRGGDGDEAELERRLAQRGLLNRIYARATGAVRTPRQMYAIG